MEGEDERRRAVVSQSGSRVAEGCYANKGQLLSGFHRRQARMKFACFEIPNRLTPKGKTPTVKVTRYVSCIELAENEQERVKTGSRLAFPIFERLPLDLVTFHSKKWFADPEFEMCRS